MNTIDPELHRDLTKDTDRFLEKTAQERTKSMAHTKKAKDITPGDKIYTSESPNRPSKVTASYSLGEDRWGLEVEDLKQILQVESDSDVRVFPY